jgi:hypothetical protein
MYIYIYNGTGGIEKKRVTQAVSPKFSKMSWQRDRGKEKDEKDQKLKSDRLDVEEEIVPPHIGYICIFYFLYLSFLSLCLIGWSALFIGKYLNFVTTLVVIYLSKCHHHIGARRKSSSSSSNSLLRPTASSNSRYSRDFSILYICKYLYIHVYICIYVCIYIYIYICIVTYMYTYIYVHLINDIDIFRKSLICLKQQIHMYALICGCIDAVG